MKIKVCVGSACKDRFSNYILDRLQNDKTRFNLNNVIIEESLCMGQCKKGPNVSVDGDIRNYITPCKASEYIMPKEKKKK